MLGSANGVSLLTGDPGFGSVESVLAGADARARDADWRRQQAATAVQARALLEGCEGRAVDALAGQLAAAAARLEELAAANDQVEAILRDYAQRLAGLQAEVARVRQKEADTVDQACRWRSRVLGAAPRVGRYSSSWQDPPPAWAVDDDVDVGWELSCWHGALATCEGLAGYWQHLTQEREQLDRDTIAGLGALPALDAMRSQVPGLSAGRAGQGAAWVAAALWSGATGLVTAQALSGLGSADAVRAVWDRLTPQQRQALVHNDPATIGNLNGVPLQYRAQANELLIQGEVARLDEQIAQLEAAVTSQTRDLTAGAGDRTPAALAQLAAQREQLTELKTLRDAYDYYLHSRQTFYGPDGKPYEVTGVPVVVFDPEHARIATYHGPFDANGDVPAWIKNLAIHVPGTGTNMANFPEKDTTVARLYTAANDLVRKEHAGPTAMIAWAGGPLPQLLDAALDKYTRDLGPRLRDFAAAVDTHPSTSALTVTGHSYGGAVVGMAESEGLAADRILYVSAAGIGNDNTKVADFPQTRDVPHYALMARNDAIVGLIQGADAGQLGHGASPLRDPDVVRLETGFLKDRDPSSGDIESLGGTSSHSGVYTVGSTAFNAVIVGGRVETYAPDKVNTSPLAWLGLQPIATDGIDREDYAPHYTQVK